MKLLRAAVLAVCLLGCEMILAGTSEKPGQSSESTDPSTDQSSPSSSPSVVTDSTSSSDSPPIEGQSSISSDATSLTSQPTGTGSTPPATSEPSGGSSAAASTQTTTPTPLPTIAMQTQKFPNDVTVHSDKAVMQKAIILSNHISALSAQIIALNSTLDPNNSVLIQSLQNMYMNATQMNKILANQTEQLGIANDKLKTQEAIYANTSRVMFCMTNTCLPTTLAPTTTAPFTGTTPPPQCISCNCSITASASDSTFTFNATTATVCSTTVSATGGTVNYTLTAASIPPEAKINVVDVGSGVTLKSYLADATSDTAYITNSTNLRFDAIPANAITYTITYSVSNPCDSYCGTNTKCTTNSQGQPICSCSQTGGCNSMSGKDCIVIDPCNNKNKNTCKNSNPPGTCKPSSDPNTCTFTCDSSSPLFLNFPEEEREVREKRGFFQRWIF